MKLVVTCAQMARDIDALRPRLDELGFDVSCPDVVQELVGDELVNAVGDATAVIAGDDRFTADVMDRCSNLRVISKWGVGVDGIDQEAAAERGIAVTNTPNAFDDEVADVTIGYVILLARQLHTIDHEVRRGGWPKPVGRSLAGRTLGIVGLGGIGRAVARRGLTMGVTVVGTDPSAGARQLAADLGVETLEVNELLARVDVLTLNCPLTPDTFHLLNADRFAHLPPGTHLVNTARGPVVDEAALVTALRDGTVAAAALDVFEQEPLPEDHPLRDFDQVVFGSHNASNTAEAGMRTHWRALDNVVQALDRKPS